MTTCLYFSLTSLLAARSHLHRDSKGGEHPRSDILTAAGSIPRPRSGFVYCLLRCAVVILALSSSTKSTLAQESPFPIPEGLAGAVEFWKQIFSRYDFNDVVLFDPLDPGKIYSVLRAPENEQGRAQVSKERGRIAADYDLVDDETRIRSQRGAQNYFIEGLKMSGRYMAEMQKIFRDEGLPAELAYLPLVESSFNIRARSSVGAVGMWQFMPETGKKFMRIDTAVDERRDPMASTRAAARLLKQNYQILGNWPLAITAYNHGTEGMFRGIKAVQSDNLVELIRGYQSPTFGFASKNFYAEFLAVVQIAINSENFFPFLRRHRPVTLQEVSLKRAVALNAVLKPAAISRNAFFTWNPALELDTKVLPLGYRVKLPAEKVDAFVTAHGRVANAPAAKRVTVKSQNSVTAARQSGPSAKPIVKAKTPLTGAVQKVQSTPKAKRRPGRAQQPPVTLAAR
ncbi:MAG: Lytic transglycosylase protein [Deltaproteobacteria bacterium]|nr:Lytic transglycosylase protein [Deltaproteobacteria bacterium]